ncbi:MAG: hypothetical protein HYS98_04170 [Deltaproteobacteria bacterium]|nr:hypothetical protein [Deltaproteobacteria bacterium]
MKISLLMDWWYNEKVNRYKLLLTLIDRFLAEEKAQVTVEYVLTLTVLIGAFVFVIHALQEEIKKFWQALLNKIAKPCPNCD